MNTITLDLSNIIKLDQKQFEKLTQNNRNLQLELTAKGELEIMPPTGGETGNRNFEIDGQLWYWNRQYNLGKAFDSSTGFILPNGATRSPDTSWITLEKWQNLTSDQRKKFIPLCPDFVIELLSENDDLIILRNKMQEYLNNGLKLGWLINPKLKTVEIYRQNKTVEILENPQTLSGENILPNFVFNVNCIFDI